MPRPYSEPFETIHLTIRLTEHSLFQQTDRHSRTLIEEGTQIGMPVASFHCLHVFVESRLYIAIEDIQSSSCRADRSRTRYALMNYACLYCRKYFDLKGTYGMKELQV